MNQKSDEVTYKITLSKSEAELFEKICSAYREFADEEPKSPEEFIAMLVNDVLLTVRRRNSWEASNMNNVLDSHFRECDQKTLDSAHEEYKL